VASLTSAQGCKINQGDCAGHTPLLWAAKNGHDGVVKLLLEREDVEPDRLENKIVHHSCGPLIIDMNRLSSYYLAERMLTSMPIQEA